MSVQSRPREAHDLDEIRRIADAQPRASDRAALLLMGRLGLRKMECARVRVHDVDLLHDRITITRAKGGKRAQLPIVYPEVRRALEAWLEEAGTADDYVVARDRGLTAKPLDPSSVHRWFKRCLRRAYMEARHDFPMHELRHSAGTELYRQTRDVLAAQELLRHRNVATTSVYLHAGEEYLVERMREMA